MKMCRGLPERGSINNNLILRRIMMLGLLHNIMPKVLTIFLRVYALHHFLPAIRQMIIPPLPQFIRDPAHEISLHARARGREPACRLLQCASLHSIKDEWNPPMKLAFLKAAEGFSKRHVLYHIEGDEVEPLHDIKRLILVRSKLPEILEQFIHIILRDILLLMQRLLAESIAQYLTLPSMRPGRP